MFTREELDDAPYADTAWLETLPRHLRATAVKLQDHFEIQPARFRRFSRSKMRAWIVSMENRAYLVEQHVLLQRGGSLFAPSPRDGILVDAAQDAL